MSAAAFSPDPAVVRRFPLGQLVTVKGLRGQYRVRGYQPDGSLALWGGSPGRQSWRSILPTPGRVTRKRRDPAVAA